MFERGLRGPFGRGDRFDVRDCHANAIRFEATDAPGGAGGLRRRFRVARRLWSRGSFEVGVGSGIGSPDREFGGTVRARSFGTWESGRFLFDSKFNLRGVEWSFT